MTEDWFTLLAAARREELKGWCKVAAILWTINHHGAWSLGGFETKREALASPELQLSPSTAQQYIDVWDAFRDVDVAVLEQARPRFLYQAVKAVRDKDNPADPTTVVHDAISLSWDSFQETYVRSRS